MSKALTKEHVRKHYSSGAVAYYESGAPVRMMTPEESAYAAQRFDEWLAEVERAAAARALEDAADEIFVPHNENRDMSDAFHRGADAVYDALRARAEAYRQEMGEQ